MKGKEAAPHLALAKRLRPASCRRLYERLVRDAADAGVGQTWWRDQQLADYLACSDSTVERNRRQLEDVGLVRASYRTDIAAWRYRVLPLRVEAVVDADEPLLPLEVEERAS